VLNASDKTFLQTAPHTFSSFFPICETFLSANVAFLLLPYAAKVFHSDAISSLCAPDFNIKDSEDQTVLALAVWSGYYKISAQLFSSGADINYK